MPRPGSEGPPSTEPTAPLRVLIVEDSDHDAERVLDELRSSGYEPMARRVRTRAEAEDALGQPWDVAVGDCSLPGFGALELLALLDLRGVDLPTIVASGGIGQEQLIEVMRAGARDYVPKGDLGRLGAAVRRELAEAEARRARRHADRALRENEERFRFLVEHSGDVLYRLRFGTMSYDYMSPGIERLTGYSLDEINQIGFASLVLSIAGPAASHVVRQELLHDRQAGKSYEFWADYQVRTRSGELRWLADHSLPWTDDTGQVVGSLGILSDITRRKEAEEALRVSESRVRTILDSALDAVIGMDAAGMVTYWNPRAEAVFGWSRAEAVGRSLQELIVPERLRQPHREGLARFLGSGEGPILDRRLELEALRRDGTEFPVELVVTAVRQGEAWSFHAFAADISERKHAEHALRRSEEHFRSLIENALDVIAIRDADGTLAYASPSVERILGYRPEEMVGREALELVHPDDQAAVRQGFEDLARRPGLVVSTRARLRHRDGSWRSFEAVGKPEQASGGRRTVVNARDITDREHLEGQLRQSQKLEAVGRLAGGVAHDFNNLVTAITGYAELTLRRMDSGDPRARNLVEIRKAADRAAALTRQLLAFSRKQVLTPRVLDLGEVVEQVERLLRRLIGEDVELRLVRAGQGRVRADPIQLEQVLMNLAINARDAMPGGGTLTIQTRDVELPAGKSVGFEEPSPGGYVMLAVTDTGRGMDSETQTHVFEPFFTTKQVGEGTGLGLSTVYGIVKQSGGHVAVESEPGRGATFRVYLPRVSDAPEEPRPGPSPRAFHRGGETILLVEDEDAIRDMLREILDDEGYTVLVAASPTDALRTAEEFAGPIHVLISDVVMPVMTGPELAARIGQLRPEVKVLFMSGYTAQAMADRGLSPERTVLLQKPFSGDALATKLREILDGR